MDRRPRLGMTTILHAVGARPNFIKVAPVVAALADAPGVRQVIVHTGQHYDERLSDDIIADLELPEPDRYLGVGSGTHAEQTGRVMIEFERVLTEESPEIVVVAGDVNSTLACALAARKVGVDVAHIESGLRSWDWTMPEEINRVLTDRLSNLLFTHSPEAETNLVAEGIDARRVRYVGNTMIDSLRRFEPVARARATWTNLGLAPREYLLTTLHRPSNVDEPGRLHGVGRALADLGRRMPVVFPVHPRTRVRLETNGQLRTLMASGVRCLDPVGYLDFLSLEIGAGAILTDSGGIQEEAAALGVPCYTFRPNTERPITLTLGTNVLIGDDPATISSIRIPEDERTRPSIPLWDGHAGERVARILVDWLVARERRELAMPA